MWFGSARMGRDERLVKKKKKKKSHVFFYFSFLVSRAEWDWEKKNGSGWSKIHLTFCAALEISLQKKKIKPNQPSVSKEILCIRPKGTTEEFSWVI